MIFNRGDVVKINNKYYGTIEELSFSNVFDSKRDVYSVRMTTNPYKFTNLKKIGRFYISRYYFMDMKLVSKDELLESYSRELKAIKL